MLTKTPAWNTETRSQRATARRRGPHAPAQPSLARWASEDSVTHRRAPRPRIPAWRRLHPGQPAIPALPSCPRLRLAAGWSGQGGAGQCPLLATRSGCYHLATARPRPRLSLGGVSTRHALPCPPPARRRLVALLQSPLVALAAFVAALALLALPGPAGAWLDGLPFSGLELAAALVVCLLLAVWWPARPDPWLAGAALGLAALALLKLALAWTVPSTGAVAVYRGELGEERPVERSTEFGWVDATRLDQRLAFTPDDFPLHFFNNSERYNCYLRGEKNRLRGNECQDDRAALPFSVVWSGVVQVPAAGDYRFWLESGGVAQLAVDGEPHLAVNGAAGHRTDRGAVSLAPGWHALTLRFRAETPAERQVALWWDSSGRREVVAAPALLPAPVVAWRLQALALTPAASTALAALAGLLGLLLAFRVGRALVARLASARSWPARLAVLGRPGLVLWLALGLIAAFQRYQGLEGRTVILPGGEDPLAYETFARDIVLNGPLMTLGHPLGQGFPYHFQPFYPYALALWHLLAGEGLYGPFVLQFFLLGASGALLCLLARRLFGIGAALATLALFQLLWIVELTDMADDLLSENFYVVALPLALLLLARYSQTGAWGALAAGGLSFGLAAITRATALSALPFVVLSIALARRRPDGARRAALACALLLLGVLLPVSLVPLRNAIVSGRPVLFATNAGVTMQMAHRPTKKVNLKEGDNNPLYRALHLDPGVRKMLEFMRQDPLGYLEASRPLAVYTLGFARAMNKRDSTHWLLVALNLLYLGGIALERRARGALALPLHGFILTHFLAMVVFVPNAYGYRQVLPMYLVMLPVAALPLVCAARSLAGALLRRAQPAGGAGAEGFAGVALAPPGRGQAPPLPD